MAEKQKLYVMMELSKIHSAISPRKIQITDDERTDTDEETLVIDRVKEKDYEQFLNPQLFKCLHCGVTYR